MYESIVFCSIRARCRRKESSRSLSHLLMSFLSSLAQVLRLSLSLTNTHSDLLDQQLLHTLAAILQIVNLLTCNPYVIVIALDFSKAFDTVRHSTLLHHKMAQLELPDTVYNWLVDFFKDHQHCAHTYIITPLYTGEQCRLTCE